MSSPLWPWSSPDADAALRTRNLASILRTYRRLNRISQEGLAVILGYDKTYISMIETGRRRISDVGALREIARKLCIPLHTLGVAESDDATFMAMIQFADSVLNLAETARRSGHAVEAVNEVWPLVARLESRAAEGLIERDSLRLLSRARLSLGVALGAVLPEERLATSARWTGSALRAAQYLDDDPAILAHVLAMHGNELRKAGRVGAAISRAVASIGRATDAPSRIAALAILSRAAGEAGNPELFDAAFARYRCELDVYADESMMLGNMFTMREIRLRGLVSTGRATLAGDMLDDLSDGSATAPQWRVIEGITVAEVLLAGGDSASGQRRLDSALREAEQFTLPHQVQRAVRAAKRYRLTDSLATCSETLERLERQLVIPVR